MNYAVAQNATGGTLTRGDVVRFASTAPYTPVSSPIVADLAINVPARLTINASVAKRLATLQKALATASSVFQTIGVVVGSYSGGTTAVNGDLVSVLVQGYLDDFTPSGSPAVDDSVYVSNTGTLALSPGTNSRVIGRVVEASGGTYRVWVDGIFNSLPTGTRVASSPATGADVQALIDAAATGTGVRRGYCGSVLIGSGNIQVSDTIYVRGLAGLLLEGLGARYTTFEWIGAADRPMFVFDRTAYCTLANLRILATQPLLLAVQVKRGVGQSDTTHLNFPSSHLTLEHVEIDGNDIMDGGFQAFLYDTGDDNKNDDHRLLDVTISGYKDFGVSFEGEQSINNQIVGCSIIGSSTAGLSTQCGVTNARRTDHVATFGISQSQVQRNKLADFDLMAQARSIEIDHVHCEHSARMVKMVNGTNGGTSVHCCALSVKASRWSSTSGEIAADKEVLSIDMCGPVAVDGCRFGAVNAAIDMKFRVSATLGSAGFTFTNTIVRTTLASGHFPGTTPQSVAGSVLYGSGNPTVPFPT